jgi:hypothetical protein
MNEVSRISKIACSKCKKEKGVRPDVLTQRILKYGSLEELLKNYVCAKCRKEHNVNAVGEEVLVTAEKEVVNAFWQQPGYVFPKGQISHPLSQDALATITLSSCLVPNLCLDGTCNKCQFYELCRLTDDKGNFRKEIDQVVPGVEKAKPKVTKIDPRTLNPIGEVAPVVEKSKGKRGRPKGSKNKLQKKAKKKLTSVK